MIPNQIYRPIFLALTGIAILFLAGCGSFNSRAFLSTVPTTIDTSAHEEIKQQKPCITIWIHGTKLTPPAIMHNFFYRKLGLHAAQSYETRYHMRTIAQTLASENPLQFCQDNFYFFGWSGKLSFKERKKAAQELYAHLLDLHEIYTEKYKQSPSIRLITHSHGGNVALNLARVRNENCHLKIDELILMACPVQTETMNLVQEPLFEKIYSFYSKADLMQIIDPQGLYNNKLPQTPLFSRHLFPHHVNLIQIETKTSRHGFSHVEFLLIKFIRHLPAIMDSIKEQMIDIADNKLTLQFIKQRQGFKRNVSPDFIVYRELPAQLKRHQSWHLPAILQAILNALVV